MRKAKKDFAQPEKIPVFFEDTHLDQVLEALLPRDADGDLKEVFYTICPDKRMIVYRQEVMRALDDAEILSLFEEFCRSMESAARLKACGKQSHHRAQQYKYKLDGTVLYFEAIKRLLSEAAPRDILFDVMSGGSNKIAGACRQVMTHPLTCEEAIYKRRAVVRDAVDNAGVFSEMLATADEAIKDVQAYSEFHSPKYDRVVSSANKIIMETEIARLYLKHLRGLTSALKSHSDSFLSDALRKLCRLMDEKCSDDTLFRIENRIVLLDGLKTSGGVSISGRIGTGLKQTEIILNGLCGTENRRRRRPKEGQTAIPLSSASLIRNADEITETALAPVYRSIADFNKELRRFFEKLHFQLCFFVGCANLWRKLNELKIPICDPAIGPNTGQYGASMIIDASLALKEGIVPAQSSENKKTRSLNPFLFKPPENELA